MPETCKICGLPKELCICEGIAKEQQRINIYTEERKFGKKVVIVEGLDPKAIDLKSLLKELKSRLACGGTIKNNQIELQGGNKERVRDILVELGFPKESVHITE